MDGWMDGKKKLVEEEEERYKRAWGLNSLRERERNKKCNEMG